MVREADFSHVTFAGDRAVGAAAPARRALVAAAPGPEEQLDAGTEALFAEVCARGGTDVGHYRRGVLLRRQAACLRALRAGNPEQAVRVMRRDAEASERALGAVMIGVTEFFRKPQAFEALRQVLREIEGREGGVSVLSIGCSTGQEVYSLAMLLAEEGMLEGAELVGVDCREAAIRAARAGVYSAEALAGAPARLREAYMRAEGGSVERYRVAEELRSACRWVVADAFAFARGEAGEEWVGRTFDVVACRNLTIYLKPAAAEELWRLLGARLKAGGILMAGKAERPSPGRFYRVGPCLYRARGES